MYASWPILIQDMSLYSAPPAVAVCAAAMCAARPLARGARAAARVVAVAPAAAARAAGPRPPARGGRSPACRDRLARLLRDLPFHYRSRDHRRRWRHHLDRPGRRDGNPRTHVPGPVRRGRRAGCLLSQARNPFAVPKPVCRSLTLREIRPSGRPCPTTTRPPNFLWRCP